MIRTKDIRSLTDFRQHAAEHLERLAKSGGIEVLTVNGEAKAVLQDVHSYEQTQETLALLKILALGNRQIENREVQSATAAIRQIRAKRKSR